MAIDLPCGNLPSIDQWPSSTGLSTPVTPYTIFVDDFDVRLAEIANRGIKPTKQEIYSNGGGAPL